MKSTRYTDSQLLHEELLYLGLNVQGLIDVLISMFLAGDISSDLVRENYKKRQEKIIKTATKTLLKNRFNK
jgi:hypothetical protein